MKFLPNLSFIMKKSITISIKNVIFEFLSAINKCDDDLKNPHCSLTQRKECPSDSVCRIISKFTRLNILVGLVFEFITIPTCIVF